MKCGILIFPGGHGDTELKHILSYYLGRHVEEIWYMDPGPFNVDVLFIPGGFPCKESREGSDCFRNSPALNSLADFAGQGRIIVGFGNGFRLLSEAGLLPGRLLHNAGNKFICRQLYIRADHQHTVITHLLENEKAYRVPIATYFGRYDASEKELIRMRQDEQIIFRYCDHNGRITESVNYTGSVDNIAGVCNKKKNVFGMIPQPERAVINGGNHADGRIILNSILQYA